MKTNISLWFSSRYRWIRKNCGRFYNHIDTSEFELEFLLQGSEDVEFSEHFKKLCRNPLVVHRIPKLRPHIQQALKRME